MPRPNFSFNNCSSLSSILLYTFLYTLICRSRFADDQLALKNNLLRILSLFNPPEQLAHGGAAYLSHRLGQGGQAWNIIFSGLQPVKTGHRAVPRHPDPRLVE